MKKIKAFLAAVMMLAALPAGQSIAPVTVSAAAENLNGYYVIRNVNSGIYLSQSETSTNVVQSSPKTLSDFNFWKLEVNADGYYQILSPAGKALSLESSGNNISVDTAKSADNQLFNLSANADGSFKLVIKSTGNAVEVINAETTDGVNVQQWEINGANCQDWELIPISYVDTSATETKVTVTGDDFTAGDLNDDGIVNIYDLILAKKLLISGNGTEHQQHAGNVTGSGTFSTADVVSLTKYLHGNGNLVKPAVDSERRYAAVDGEFTDAYVETTNAGYTEEAYLNLYNELGTSATWNISASSAGVYALTVRYANGGTSDRTVQVTLNNQIVYWTLEGKTTGAWTTWEEETIYIPLSAGVNALTFTSLTADGAANIDYVSLKNTTQSESPSQPISPVKGTPLNVNSNNQKGVGIQMEYLNRGVSAAYTGTGMLVSWRILATDNDATYFKLYKNGEFVAQINAGEATNYFIEGGTPTDLYTVDTFVGTTMTEFANVATIFGTKNSGQSGAYFDINTQKPADQTMPDGTTCTYTENDCSVGDIDGDGQYEIFVKWDPSNSQDNSKDGYTGTTFFDCYRLDGTLVWRIDLGINIRSGAHYTQFLVYDFDGDGKCELICKTADGTKDGQGNYIGDKSKDYRSTAGRILTGPEYITLFDGATGKALDTQNYDPARGTVADWGDSYGNRVDRFTACVAYLDGEHASACFGRGYYTRSVVAAWDVSNGKLVKRWTYDTGYNASTAGYGDGNHHILGADVDGDGKQEVVVGSAVVDDNGKLLYTTSNAHGDAIHIGDFVPSNPGLEIFQCLEDETHPNGKTINYGVELRDAKTGKALFRETAGGDTGRAIADNLVAGNDGAEMCGSHNGILYDCTTGKQMVDASGNGMTFASITKWGQNSVVYWTDVLERAVLDRTMADQYGKGRVFTGDGVTYNNYTKSNACLTCDLMGDWREEMIFRKSDGGLRVFTTTFTSEYPIYSLMHNPQYRVQVAAQNNGYNQPPHTDYFLGTGYELPTAPAVYNYKAE
ncbi:MAG: RICIN domain-containing protein [Oscillospiraceae bacterium]|nr:RICIN domain-containing protein [Oscillospiraceae bacterium]